MTPLNVAASWYRNNPGLSVSNVAVESHTRLPVLPQRIPVHPPVVVVKSQWMVLVGSVRTPSGPSVVPSQT